MLYPTIETEYYPEISKFHNLLSETREKMPFYIIHVIGHCKTETPLETFIEYTIVTERESKFTVVRRFSDFDWLMKHLYQKYPLYILPPIPTKRIFTTTDKYNRLFINKRQDALERMMHRLGYFQNCLEDSLTQAFLKMNQKEFDKYRQNHKNQSLVKLVQLSIHKVYLDTVLSFKGEETCDIKDESTVTCFEIIHKRITERSTLSIMLNSLEDMSYEWEIFSQCLLWIAQNVADVVLMTENSEITILMDGVAQFFFNWSTESKSYYSSLMNSLSPIINEYIAYDNHIINIVRNRNQIKGSLHFKKKTILTLQSQLNSTGYDYLPKGNKFDQLMTESIVLEDQLTDFDRIFYPTLEDWQHQKSCDIAKCLNNMVQTNIKYHKSCLELCKNLLNKIIENY